MAWLHSWCRATITTICFYNFSSPQTETQQPSHGYWTRSELRSGLCSGTRSYSKGKKNTGPKTVVTGIRGQAVIRVGGGSLLHGFSLYSSRRGEGAVQGLGQSVLINKAPRVPQSTNIQPCSQGHCLVSWAQPPQGWKKAFNHIPSPGLGSRSQGNRSQPLWKFK